MKLFAISYPNGNMFSIGKDNIVDMTVIMENGQMATVPWAVISYEYGKIGKVNLSFVIAVELLEINKENESAYNNI